MPRHRGVYHRPGCWALLDRQCTHRCETHEAGHSVTARCVERGFSLRQGDGTLVALTPVGEVALRPVVDAVADALSARPNYPRGRHVDEALRDAGVPLPAAPH